MVAISDVDELSSNAKPVTRPADAAFQKGAHVELLSNRSQIHRLSLEGERRGSRGYVQVSDLRKTENDFFADSVGEQLVFGIAGEIQEWQYRDGSFGNGVRHRLQEPIAAFRHCLDEARRVGRVPDC